MTRIIDAMGQNCPMPVIMAKKEIDGGAAEFVVQVDNQIAVENLKKLAGSQGFETVVEGADDFFSVAFAKECIECEDLLADLRKQEDKGAYTIFVGKDYIGAGNETLGRSLMQMFFYTLSQSDDLPESICFMNAGVKLPTEDDQVVEHLTNLSTMGVEILVCGACLNFYELTEKLRVGEISNMYDILTKMQKAVKVITV